MGRFLRRNAIFFLFPAVVVAIVFLARINLSTAMRFGEWGEKSIVESTLVLAKEKVVRVEKAISGVDHQFFRFIDPSNIENMCREWQRATRLSNLVQAAAVIDSENLVIEYMYRSGDDKKAKHIYDLFVNEVVPMLDTYDSLYQHKHSHRLIQGEYLLVTSLSTEFEGQYYTACIVYDTEEITGDFFRELLADIGPERVINVEDHNGVIVYGDTLNEAGEFIAIQRFPSTLYKWKLQLAPRLAALYSKRARTQKFSQWMLIPLAFGVILFGLVVLYMAMVRERRLSSLKSEFIANTSHELKTPLALIRMFSELLSMGMVRDDMKVRRYHEIILRETERLSSLIDNVLDYARIEKGKSAYEFRLTNLKDVVEPAIDVYRHRVDDTGISLVYKSDDEIPPVSVDGDAITLALINLIDNALKYAKGTNIIGVELIARKNAVYLEVYDNGTGIPPQHQKRIFERFYRFQASDLETRGHRGSGIGLNLVRHIARAHGGMVSVSSTPGVETRFSIKLPVVES